MKSTRTTEVDAFTDLVLEVFRMNGTLLAAGDRLVADIGLTSARWQVLGAVYLAGTPLPVSHIARNMGRTRQSVQRVTNDLAKEGLIVFARNPHHQRAKLVVLTDKGLEAWNAAHQRQVSWADSTTAGLSHGRISAAVQVIRELRHRLEADEVVSL